MNNSCYDIAEFFRNIFDVPKYYVFEGNSGYYDVDNLYSIINDINIFIIGNSEFKPNCKINDIVRICDGSIYYDILIPLDDYNILILNDVIKTLGGVIYEKTTLQY